MKITRRFYITLTIGRPYIHRPFHPGLPTWRDWRDLIVAGGFLLFALRQYDGPMAVLRELIKEWKP